MSIVIRPTTIDDAPQIAEIIHLAFGEKSAVSQISSCVKNGNTSFVAEKAGQVVGFVDGFATLSAEEEKRRELDLLAVHPDCQGQGIGTKLIECYTNLDIPADYIRSLIAVGNTRMEKALTRYGYSPQNDICALYVSTAIVAEKTIAPPRHFVPVSTYTYNGIWLEGEITQQMIDAGLSVKLDEQDTLGAVVPVMDLDAVGLLQSNNFTLIKLYRYWMKHSA